jgi:hypothetical protein
MEIDNLVSVADRHIGASYPSDFKCVSFVRMLYSEVGLSIDFYNQPVITSLDDLFVPENIGKIIFLMRKNCNAYLYSHVAIIYDNESVVHYSRHLNIDGIRRVEISSFADLLSVYDLVPNPYSPVINKKVKTPHL